jgi:hypothetical protein
LWRLMHCDHNSKQRHYGTAAFFIAHLVSSVIYHADRDKEKCDLRRKAQGFVEWEGQNQPEIELNVAVIGSSFLRDELTDLRPQFLGKSLDLTCRVFYAEPMNSIPSA